MKSDAGYVPINGLNMYYEIHGAGEPLLVLPGAYMTVELMGDLVSALGESRRVITVEFQGHGHTADIDRVFSLRTVRGRHRRRCRHISESSRPTSTATA